MRLTIIAILILIATANCPAQNTTAFADSVRQLYKIPELSYAIVSADSVYEVHALGVRKINTQWAATLSDRFRIGSNTKAITGFIAAQLVKEGKLSWNTKFFDLFPEMKSTSNKAYWQLTLLNLLTFRARLIKYTYTDDVPAKGQFTGNKAAQRYQFTNWFFKQPPVVDAGICYSNLGFVAAGLMLEKASGKPYQQLVKDLGSSLGINFDFGQPNLNDSMQTWGHNAELVPEPPYDNYKLNWLLAAGNINVTLPDYIKFIQLQLRGLQGRSPLLPQAQFDFLHYGLPNFAVGWFWDTDSTGQQFSYNVGNPGTYLTKVYVYKTKSKAMIIFTNAQTPEADKGIDVLYDKLKQVYALE